MHIKAYQSMSIKHKLKHEITKNLLWHHFRLSTFETLCIDSQMRLACVRAIDAPLNSIKNCHLAQHFVTIRLQKEKNRENKLNQNFNITGTAIAVTIHRKIYICIHL